MKTVIVLMLVAVLVALASAGLFMLRGNPEGQKREGQMARALALRVGLSIALFLFVLLSYLLGWIQPSGIPISR